MKKAILLSCLIGLASPAFAADWVLVARGSNSSTISVDRDSIMYNRASGIVTAWILKEGYQEEYKGQTEVSNKGRSEYYCKTRQFRPLGVLYYNSMGGVIDSITLSNPSMHHVAPDTVGENIINSVCTNPPQVISQYEQPDDAAQAAYESAAASAFAATVAAFLAQPENQILKEGSPEYNVLNDQVIYLQTNQPDLDSVTLLEKARKATAAIIDIPPVPEKRSAPRATPRPAARPAPQPQRTPESRAVGNRPYL